MQPNLQTLMIDVTSKLTKCLNLGQFLAFFSGEPVDNLFQNLMGRLFFMKGSDCAIFHIFLITFWCASQKFKDYFCIWTFSPQWLMRLD
jgi:hypothetical protein